MTKNENIPVHTDYNPVEARLDEFAGSVMIQKTHEFGYPGNQKSGLVHDHYGCEE